MTTKEYLALRHALWEEGYVSEYDWSQGLKPPKDATAFAVQYTHVVVNSGMQAQVADVIMERIRVALNAGQPVLEGFKHPGKAAAIQDMWDNLDTHFAAYQQAVEDGVDLLVWCQELRWVGPITRYHLAKNLGVDVCKPDRHLVRVADAAGETPAALCQRLAEATGDRVATVDVVIWRACNLEMWTEEVA